MSVKTGSGSNPPEITDPDPQLKKKHLSCEKLLEYSSIGFWQQFVGLVKHKRKKTDIPSGKQ